VQHHASSCTTLPAALHCPRPYLLPSSGPFTSAPLLPNLTQPAHTSVCPCTAGGSPSIASELNVDAFLQQARSYEEATNSVVGWYLRNAQTRALSHPLPVMRAREVDRWAQSPEFRALLVKNSRHRVQQQAKSGSSAAGGAGGNGAGNGAGNGTASGALSGTAAAAAAAASNGSSQGFF
jgi:hypothetical protein